VQNGKRFPVLEMGEGHFLGLISGHVTEDLRVKSTQTRLFCDCCKGAGSKLIVCDLY
jgi:hypothetical protein